MRYSYQSEKLSKARSCLMLPHSSGEAALIAQAFHECSLGLHDLDRDNTDDHVRNWLSQLDELMDTSGPENSDQKGLWHVKACELSIDQKLQLSGIIDELAHWFKRNSYDSLQENGT
jgi:hypothetical protein